MPPLFQGLRRSTLFGFNDPPLYLKLFLWQMHMGRCSGPGGRVLQVHEVAKLALNQLCLCHHDPAFRVAAFAGLILSFVNLDI